jgi:multiple sugar transport system permease protein
VKNQVSTTLKTRRFNLKSKRVKENLFAYLMLAPDVIGLAIFIFLPILVALYVSFHDWNALEPMKYVGFKNYKLLMGDDQWWQSVRTTVVYALMFVPMVYCISLLIALFVNSIPGKAQEFFRTIYFIPYSISTVVAALIWMFMFDPQRGFVNEILGIFGISQQSFLGDPKQALFCIALISAWMLIGYYSVIFLAALKDIPVSYYEAAKLDGANAFQIFKNITFPLLKEVNSFVLVVTTIASFQVFDQIKILTNGGPADATNVSVFYIYKNTFEYMKLGYSSALAFVLFIIIFILSLIQLKITKGNSDD